eukprot:g12200.t1
MTRTAVSSTCYGCTCTTSTSSISHVPPPTKVDIAKTPQRTGAVVCCLTCVDMFSKKNSTRRAAKAGSWYLANGAKLDKQLQGWLDEVKLEKKAHQGDAVRAIISPHAGYAYSGSTAAYGFKHLNPDRVKRIFILGPSHALYTTTCHVTTVATYETPLGNLDVDRTAIAELLATKSFREMTIGQDEAEHSLELQLPYIAKVMKGRTFTVVPVMVGSLSAQAEKKFGQIFAPYLDDPANFFVISSDFCHWGERFSYQPCPPTESTPIWQHIQALDRQGMDAIEQQDHGQYWAYLNKYQNTICGRHPIGVFLQALKHCSTKFSVDFINYKQSNQVVDLADSSVSYCSGICTPVALPKK